jgi:hypothetical protein
MEYAPSHPLCDLLRHMPLPPSIWQLISTQHCISLLSGRHCCRGTAIPLQPHFFCHAPCPCTTRRWSDRG